MLKKGYIQIYTGDGKGKTTAAMGLALRAAGDGMKVCILQFLKAWKTGEVIALEKIENIEVFRVQKMTKFTWDLNEEEKKQYALETKEGYKLAENILKERKCDVFIIDEIMGAMHAGFLTEDDVLKLMELKRDDMELVMTGRGVSDKIAEKADLITEMKPIKHYFEKGVDARKGIEF